MARPLQPMHLNPICQSHICAIHRYAEFAFTRIPATDPTTGSQSKNGDPWIFAGVTLEPVSWIFCSIQRCKSTFFCRTNFDCLVPQFRFCSRFNSVVTDTLVLMVLWFSVSDWGDVLEIRSLAIPLVVVTLLLLFILLFIGDWCLGTLNVDDIQA